MNYTIISPEIIRVARLHKIISRSSKNRYLFVFIGLTLLICQLLLILVNVVQSDRAIVGLKLNQLAVSGQSSLALDNAITHQVRAIETRPITIHASSYVGHATPRQLGVKYDVSSLHRSVLQEGRTGSILRRVAVQDAALLGQRSVNIGFARSQEKLVHNYLDAINTVIQKPAYSAHFSYTNHLLGITPHILGLQLDSTKSFNKLRHVSDSGLDITLPLLPVQPRFTTQSLQPLLPEVMKIVALPLTIQAGDKHITIQPEQLIELIDPVLQMNPIAPSQQIATVSYNDSRLSKKVDEIASQVSAAPTPTITNGKKVVTQGTPGIHVDGTHAKIEVISNLEKRGLADSNSILKSDTVIIETESLSSPIVSQYAASNTQLANYPAYAGNNKMVYLTFDDGPGGYTEDVLNILKRYNVHAIFFVVGKNTIVYPQTIRRMLAEGHTVGNHSYTHRDLAVAKPTTVVDELFKTQAAVQSIVGTKPTLFRPPYGSLSPTVNAVAASNNLSLMMWTVDPRDWSKPGPEVITQRVLVALRPGSNVLLHSIHQQTMQALPAIIEGIRAKGFTLP